MDVLRIVLTIFVITLHFNNSMGGRAFIYTTNINYELALIFESFSLCAVNVFLILSGYFLCNRKDRDIIKIFLFDKKYSNPFCDDRGNSKKFNSN